MKARHIAVVALSAFAAIAGSASAADDGVIHSRTVLDGHPRHWEGSGIPAHLVRNDKPVVVSTDRLAQFGQFADGLDTCTRRHDRQLRELLRRKRFIVPF